MRQRIVLVGALALLLLLHGPALVSAMWGNAGMLMLRHALLAQVDLAPGTYPVRNALQGDSAMVLAMQHLRRAMALNGDNLTAQWALGRAALTVGDVGTAADALRSLVEEARDNPLLYHDVLTALSYSGRSEDVIALYESSLPPHPTQVISDVVALAYLERSQVAGEQSDEEAVANVAQLRPGDLYVNYYLWQTAMEAGDVEAAAAYSETLVYFPLEAIHPADERLLDYVADAVPDLLEEWLWDRHKTLNVVSFLVWQHSGATGVERLLEQLIERYPTEPDWPFYLAELYHRRGDLERAKGAYRQALTVDPAYAQTYLRLGMVAEAESRNGFEEAARWYEQHHELVPNDLLAFKRLVEVCTALEDAGVEDESCLEAAGRVMGGQRDKEAGRPGEGEILHSPATVLWEALEARTDDRQVVAELLDVPVESVELGPNLLENGDFEEWVNGRPEWWQWSNMATGNPWNKGAFAGGADALSGGIEGGLSARVDGLWLQRNENKPVGRCGWWLEQEISLDRDSQYVISFFYRTTSLPKQARGASLWWSSGKQVYLPETNRLWRHFAVPLWDCVGGCTAQPLLRSFSIGQVWFDNVSMKPIRVENSSDD